MLSPVWVVKSFYTWAGASAEWYWLASEHVLTSLATAHLQLSDANWPVSMCWHPLLQHLCSWLMLTGQWACAGIPCYNTSAAELMLTSLATAHLQLSDADWPVSVCWHPMLQHICSWVMLNGQWACADIPCYSTSAADWCWLASEHVLASLATTHLQLSLCWHPLLQHICSWVMLTGQWACADIPCYSTSAAEWCWLASEHVLTSLATAHLQLTDADWPVSMCWHPLLQHICSWLASEHVLTSLATAHLQLTDADWPVSMCWHPLLQHICSWVMLTGQWACAGIPCYSTSAAELVLTSLAMAHLQPPTINAVTAIDIHVYKVVV